MDYLTSARWWKSSHSGEGGACVETAVLPGGLRGVRDSKNPTGPVLEVPVAQWAMFIAGIQVGQFG